MGSPPISVTVRRYPDRKHLMLVWTDPVTGKRRTKTARTANQREAHRAASELEKQLNSSIAAQDGSMVWREFTDRYVATHCVGMKPTARSKVVTVLSTFTTTMQPQWLRSVTGSVLTDYVTRLRQRGLAEATIAGYLTVLHTALNWARKQGYLADLPRFPVAAGRAHGGRAVKGRALTLPEFVRLLRAVPAHVGELRAPAYRRLLIGLWLSGLRITEALQLTWDDRLKLWLDWSGRWPLLMIPAEFDKGGKDRQMPLTPDFSRFLARTPAGERSGYVFPLPGERTEDARSMFYVGRIIGEIGKLAQIVTNPRTGKHASAHDLRRTFGTRWAGRVLPQLLKDLMRHESIETTLRYYVQAHAYTTAEALWKIDVKNSPKHDHHEKK